MLLHLAVSLMGIRALLMGTCCTELSLRLQQCALAQDVIVIVECIATQSGLQIEHIAENLHQCSREGREPLPDVLYPKQKEGYSACYDRRCPLVHLPDCNWQTKQPNDQES